MILQGQGVDNWTQVLMLPQPERSLLKSTMKVDRSIDRWIYLSICLFVCLSIYLSMYACMHACMHTYIHTYTYTNINVNVNPPAPKVLGRDRPDGTRKRLQVYLGGGGIFRPKPPVFDRS